MKNPKVQKSKDVKMCNHIIELFKNRKAQISKRCENVKSNNRIIQRMWNIKKINAAFENPIK